MPKRLPDTNRIFQCEAHTIAPSSAVKLEAGSVPRRRFVKDLVRVGEYVSNGVRFAITQADLDRWVENTKRFIEAGNEVPIPDGHTDEATANRGYVLDLYRDGDTLYGIVEMIGEDGIATAYRSKVSINTDVDYIDGKGNKYPDVITHVALTNAPVVPDQSGFVPIAASLSSSKHTKRARVFALSQENESMEYLTKIAGLLGIKDIESLDESKLTEAIVKSIEAMHGDGESLAKDAKAKGEEVEKLKMSLSKATQKPEPAPALVRLAAENRSMKLSRLAEQGKITPAVKDKLEGIFIGKDNAALKLSLDDASDGQFAALVEALSENASVVNVGGGRTVNKDNGGGGGDTQDKELIARMAKAVGVAVK